MGLPGQPDRDTHARLFHIADLVSFPPSILFSRLPLSLTLTHSLPLFPPSPSPHPHIPDPATAISTQRPHAHLPGPNGRQTHRQLTQKPDPWVAKEA